MSDYLVGGDPSGARVPGSVIERCSRCNALVVIAPSGQATRAERGLLVLCMACAIGEVSPDNVQPLTGEQVAELIAYWASQQ